MSFALGVKRGIGLTFATLLLGSCTGGGTASTPTATLAASPSASLPPVATRPPPPGAFELVGHEPLYGRGMNAAIAIGGHYAYIGSRTDASEGHIHPGVLVVDIKDPSQPKVVGEIGPPAEGNPGETSRELRIWPEEDLLMVLNFGCDDGHDCGIQTVVPTIRFFDISGKLAAKPALVSTYHPSRVPHEFYLWVDPSKPGRALLFMSTPGQEGSLLVVDISGARQGDFREVASWETSFRDPGPDDNLHSVSVSVDGKRAYLAHLSAGFFILDVSSVTNGYAAPRIEMVTPLAQRAQWSGAGPHSAVKVPGRDLVLATDEVYGGSGPGRGCPWGWVRLIDVADESAPQVVSEYQVLPYNDAAYCDQVSSDRDLNSSFSSHNPTVTGELAFVTWHSAGLQAISIEDPLAPEQMAEFIPLPLDSVATEDPLLSSGPDKVVMWSYPIMRDGLIYVVDVRNGLYVLRYDGPGAEDVASIGFLEGNSNLGDAA